MSVGGDQQCAISSLLLLKRSAYTHKDPSKSCNTCGLAHAFTCGDKNRILNNSKQFMLQLLLCKSLWMHEIFCGGGGHWRESHPKICKFFFGLDFSFVDVRSFHIIEEEKPAATTYNFMFSHTIWTKWCSVECQAQTKAYFPFSWLLFTCAIIRHKSPNHKWCCDDIFMQNYIPQKRAIIRLSSYYQ